MSFKGIAFIGILVVLTLALPPAHGAGDSKVTLDLLDDGVTARSKELCEELGSASADRVAALKTDYAQFRQEEVKRLDAMQERQQGKREPGLKQEIHR